MYITVCAEFCFSVMLCSNYISVSHKHSLWHREQFGCKSWSNVQLNQVWCGDLKLRVHINWKTDFFVIFPLQYLLSPLCCTGTGSRWFCWQPHGQPWRAGWSRGRPAPSGDTAQLQMLHTLLLSHTQGQSLPGCPSYRITRGNIVSSACL